MEKLKMFCLQDMNMEAKQLVYLDKSFTLGQKTVVWGHGTWSQDPHSNRWQTTETTSSPFVSGTVLMVMDLWSLEEPRIILSLSMTPMMLGVSSVVINYQVCCLSSACLTAEIDDDMITRPQWVGDLCWTNPWLQSSGERQQGQLHQHLGQRHWGAVVQAEAGRGDNMSDNVSFTS